MNVWFWYFLKLLIYNIRLLIGLNFEYHSDQAFLKLIDIGWFQTIATSISFEGLIEQNHSISSSGMQGNRKGNSPAISLSEVVFFKTFPIEMLERNFFVTQTFCLTKLRHHNGKLFLCPPQKQPKTQLMFSTAIFQTKFTLQPNKLNTYMKEIEFTSHKKYCQVISSL